MPPPTINVDKEVFAALQKQATPLVDTANDVLRRVLGLGTVQRGGTLVTNSQFDSDHFTPNRDYRKPILQILVEMGGRARTGDVLDRLPLKMSLTDGDHEETSSGKIRYRHHAEFERLAMVKEGLISSTSPHGVWETTDGGRRWLNENP